MATSKANTGLHSLPLARLAQISAAINETKVKRFKDKNTAIKAIGRTSKQNLVKALLTTGGASVDEIQALFSIRKAYARDIISKLQKKGVEIAKSEEGVFSA